MLEKFMLQNVTLEITFKMFSKLLVIFPLSERGGGGDRFRDWGAHTEIMVILPVNLLRF